MDLRLQQLSYSSLLLLHACPRKFQLYRLRATADTLDPEKSREQSVTFAFGHTVGLGLQLALQDLPEEGKGGWLWQMFLNWEVDLLGADEKRGKSFWLAVIAIRKLAYLRSQAGLYSGWKVLQWQGKPAAELGLCVSIPGSSQESTFYYRGFVDLVMQHESTGKVMVLEAKTTWNNNVNPAQYKNSSQAIGYSVVLDHVVPGLSDYMVQYPVYKTKEMAWEFLPFPKWYKQRAGWLQELLFDTQDLERYQDAAHFPKRGESCCLWNRECEYLSSCGLKTEYLINKLSAEDEQKILEENSKYQIKVTFDELVQAQMQALEAGIVAPEEEAALAAEALTMSIGPATVQIDDLGEL